ncbi:aspartate--tRNA(Asn) ligase [Patescibacteria group bacterium]|nr:MAG: aspartate--tRNA(Asn) ligase [Patescibacteria group bacterium]
MTRTLINETPKLIGQTIKLAGWVHVRRDHGKIIFIDLRDRSGIVQMVVIPGDQETYEAAKTVRSEFVIEVEGLVKERPASAVKQGSATGTVEIEVKKLTVLGKVAGELPVDISKEDMDLNLDTLLNNRTLTLRHVKIKAIFQIYGEVLRSFSEIVRRDGFQEIKSPKILNSATEGGANFFKIKYFEQEAYLAQSPQFYKQAGVGAFERVFEIGSVFRAEPHFTTRHVNEYIGLDAEMGFIQSFEDVMNELEEVMMHMFASIEKRCGDELALYGATVPKVKVIPRMRLTQALEILEREYGKKIEGVDIDPEGERLICEWAAKEYGSELVFLTHYPVSIRPFYTMPSADGEFTESFDLLFRGLEIATGGQRIHDYDQLVESIKRHNLKPEDFEHYLDIFKYGMPPHGGWGLGSERIVQQTLGLQSIKEAVLFPRDVKRLTP